MPEAQLNYNQKSEARTLLELRKTEQARERRATLWRLFLGFLIVLIAAGIIYYGYKGFVFLYDKFFVPGVVQQQSVSTAASTATPISGNGDIVNEKPAQPSEPVVSNENIIPVPAVPSQPVPAPEFF